MIINKKIYNERVERHKYLYFISYLTDQPTPLSSRLVITERNRDAKTTRYI